MKWIKCSDRMPVIDPAKPAHYLFKHWDNVRVINIWTEFIRDFPPMITVHKIEWVWLDESTPPEKTYSEEERDKFAINFGIWLIGRPITEEDLEPYKNNVDKK